MTRPYQQLPPPPIPWGGFSTDDQAFLRTVWTDFKDRRITGWEELADRFRASEEKRGRQPDHNEADLFVQDVNSFGLRPLGINVDDRLKTGGYPVDTQVGSDNGRIRSRIYLNTTGRAAPTVYKYVRDTLEPPLRVPGHGESGIVFSKMASHDIASSARDVIVVYTTGEQANEQVLGELRRYQTVGVRALFVDETVRMTEPAAELRGVGVGADPPTYRQLTELADEYRKNKPQEWQKERGDWQKEVNLSFSQYRSALIFAAMEKARGSSADAYEEEKAFAIAVTNNFREAGLDPAHPGRQGQANYRVVGVLEKLFF